MYPWFFIFRINYTNIPRYCETRGCTIFAFYVYYFDQHGRILSHFFSIIHKKTH